METKLNICMLVNLRYQTGTVEQGPANRKGIIAYIANFGHNVTWVVLTEEVNSLQQFRLGNIFTFVIPYTPIFNTRFFIGRILNKVLNVNRRIRTILSIFREGQYNVIYVKGDVLSGLIAIYIKKKYGVPVILDVEPLGMRWESYKINSRRPLLLYYVLARFWDLVTKYLMKKADLITPSSEWFANTLIQRGIPRYKLMPYPNGVDIAAFGSKDGKRIREKYQIGDSQVITYIGTLDKIRNLSILIEAFTKVRCYSKNVKLLVVGEGSDAKNIKRLVHDLEIEDDVILTGQVPGSEIAEFIAATDIGVSPIPPTSYYIISSPIKMFEYMAGGKPVIANEEIFDHKEVLEQSGGGILIPFNPEAFADAMIRLLTNPESAVEMGCRGRKWVCENRSYEILARRVEQRYLEIITN